MRLQWHTWFETIEEAGTESLAHNGSINPDQNVFRELDNPTLFLYIEAHVTAQQTYIPGMTVPFKRYREVEFALPGEL